MDIQTAYLEIRGATGGDEAKIWGSDLLRMYVRFAQKIGWKVVQLGDLTVKITNQESTESKESRLPKKGGGFILQRPQLWFYPK